LFDYIIASGAIPQLEAVCIVAQVLKAIEYMHSEGTAHRDLKPENLLFKHTDHQIIKIADFGESKSFRDGTLTTYCGTPDYMAPEIIRGESYGPEVDVWAIGVITYVMLAGFPPFDGENDVEVFASILSIRYEFPSPEWDNISDEAKHFVKSILVDSPKERLTATECLQHPWIFNNVPLDLRSNVKKNPGVANAIKAEKEKPETKESPAAPLKKSKKLNEDVDLDMVKNPNPRKFILDLMEEITQMVPDPGSPFLGEIKAMQVVVEATTGKKPLVDLEKTIYQTYLKRLVEIRSGLKQQMRKKKKK